MTIKPVADLYLIKYEDGRLYKCTRDAEEAVDAIGFGFEVEEFVSLDNHRAAMLQGAAGNSPVLPDGWVACSERMPETYVNVLLTDEHDDVCIGQMEFEGDVYFYVVGYPHGYKATHWMPLPAAPLQEA